VPKKPAATHDGRRRSDSLSSIHVWQDRVRDPSLTVLLVLELCTIFVAAPLAAKLEEQRR